MEVETISLESQTTNGELVTDSAHPRVVLVHDYLTQFGGAERVLVALHDLFPAAPVHTSLVDYRELPAGLREWDIRECFPRLARRLPRFHRALLPLYGPAFRSIGIEPDDADVVIADSSAWSHNVGVQTGIPLLCYCHSPARFLYEDTHYLAPARLPFGIRTLAPHLFKRLREDDRGAAARVDRFIANSKTVAERIRLAYGREATVIYPPVDVARFAGEGVEATPEPWYLVVSRLVPHKRIDLAVETCTRFNIPLKVIGTGRSMTALQKVAGPSVEFLESCDDAAIADHLRRCRALILPGAEDFGLTAVEAQAAGRPVIAFGMGGALESVVAGETGLHFDRQTPEALHEAIEEFEARSWDPALARANAARFDLARFQREIAAEVEDVLAAARRGLPRR
jgi:glycosyltransferase involved in cell wall biosynthesis